MDVVVDDEYMEAMAKRFEKEYAILTSVIQGYIRILQEITEGGITEGKTSEALKTFTNQAKTLEQVFKHKDAATRYCTEFVGAIDEIDGDLY